MPSDDSSIRLSKPPVKLVAACQQDCMIPRLLFEKPLQPIVLHMANSRKMN
jgi:hypothetical protein